jgi:glycerol-3-phosphate O-acyltransferase
MKNYIKSIGNGDARKDIKFIPVSLSYEIVYEASTFPLELLGESKEPESLYRVLR